MTNGFDEFKIYLIDGEAVSADEFNSQLESALYDDCENNYDDMLNDCNGDIKIGSLTYETAHALRIIDPIAYRCGLSDYASSVLSDAQYYIENGESVIYDSIKFEVKYDDSDESDE